MAREKKIKRDQVVDIPFSLAERQLVLEHTFADPELTAALQIAEVKGKSLVAKYTLDDLDELLGYIAAEANHSKDKKLERELHRLFSRLRKELESYDDGEWPNAF